MTPGALAAAGARVRRAVDDEVRPGVDEVVTAARAIATALPGTRSADLAEELARRWEGFGAVWVAALRAHGEALVAAAASQEATDDAAASVASGATAPFVRTEGTSAPFVPYGGGGGGRGTGSAP